MPNEATELLEKLAKDGFTKVQIDVLIKALDMKNAALDADVRKVGRSKLKPNDYKDIYKNLGQQAKTDINRIIQMMGLVRDGFDRLDWFEKRIKEEKSYDKDELTNIEADIRKTFREFNSEQGMKRYFSSILYFDKLMDGFVIKATDPNETFRNYVLSDEDLTGKDKYIGELSEANKLPDVSTPEKLLNLVNDSLPKDMQLKVGEEPEKEEPAQIEDDEEQNEKLAQEKIDKLVREAGANKETAESNSKNNGLDSATKHQWRRVGAIYRDAVNALTFVRDTISGYSGGVDVENMLEQLRKNREDYVASLYLWENLDKPVNEVLPEDVILRDKNGELPESDETLQDYFARDFDRSLIIWLKDRLAKKWETEMPDDWRYIDGDGLIKKVNNGFFTAKAPVVQQEKLEVNDNVIDVPEQEVIENVIDVPEQEVIDNVIDVPKQETDDKVIDVPKQETNDNVIKSDEETEKPEQKHETAEQQIIMPKEVVNEETKEEVNEETKKEVIEEPKQEVVQKPESKGNIIDVPKQEVNEEPKQEVNENVVDNNNIINIINVNNKESEKSEDEWRKADKFCAHVRDKIVDLRYKDGESDGHLRNLRKTVDNLFGVFKQIINGNGIEKYLDHLVNKDVRGNLEALYLYEHFNDKVPDRFLPKDKAPGREILWQDLLKKDGFTETAKKISTIDEFIAFKKTLDREKIVDWLLKEPGPIKSEVKKAKEEDEKSIQSENIFSGTLEYVKEKFNQKTSEGILDVSFGEDLPEQSNNIININPKPEQKAEEQPVVKEEPAEMSERSPQHDEPKVEQPKNAEELPAEVDWQMKKDYMLERLEVFSQSIEESKKETWFGSAQFEAIRDAVEAFQESLKKNEDPAELEKKRETLRDAANHYHSVKAMDQEKTKAAYKIKTQNRLSIAGQISNLMENEFKDILDEKLGVSPEKVHPASNPETRYSALRGLQNLIKNSQRNIWGGGSQEFKALEEAVDVGVFSDRQKIGPMLGTEYTNLENIYKTAQKYLDSKQGKTLNANGEARKKIAESAQKYVVAALRGLGKNKAYIEKFKNDISAELTAEAANKGAKQKGKAKPVAKNETMKIK